MVSLLLAFIWAGLFFIVTRFIFKVVFQRLTAHWLALGLSGSYSLGLLIYWLLTSHKLLLDAIQSGSGNSIFYDLAISWLIALLVLNLLVLPSLYWWDKRIATINDSKRDRIPENALHALTFFGGFLGAYIGQKVFRHKISKQSFQIKHYVICGLSIAIYIYIACNIVVSYGSSTH